MKLIRISMTALILLLLISMSFANAVNSKHLEGVNINGRLLVPMRSIFQELGASVNWDSNTRSVTGTKGNTEVKLSIDSRNAYINSKLHELDVPATIVNSSTYVPSRFVSEALGAKVNWHGSLRMAEISLGDMILQIYEELPEEPEIITSEYISYSITPRVIKNGDGKTIDIEAVVTNKEKLPLEGINVSIFIESHSENRSNQVNYDSEVTDENGKIRASYTTTLQDNNKNFIITMATMIDDKEVMAYSNFIVTNSPTVYVSGTALNPINGNPLVGDLVTASLRDPHKYIQLAKVDNEGKFDGYLVVNDKPYYIGADIENTLNVSNTYNGSNSSISNDYFRFEFPYKLDSIANTIINLKTGIVKGYYTNSISSSEVIAFKIINGKPYHTQGYAVPVAPDGTYMLVLQEGKYEILDMRSAKTINSNFTVTQGKTIDLGSFTR